MIRKPIYTMYIPLSLNMVRRMIATITQIESVVTPSGNSGHVVVPKAWIGKEARQEGKGEPLLSGLIRFNQVKMRGQRLYVAIVHFYSIENAT
jgi:hypothetical protein